MADATTQADTATTDATTADDTSTQADPPVTDWEAEAKKWQGLAQKHEGRAKSNSKAAKELEDLKLSSLDDQQRAVAEAAQKANQDAAAKFGGKLVDAELRAAAVGRTFDTDALLSLDRTQFLTDDGDADSDAIKAWVEEHSKSAEPAPEPAQGPLSGIDLGQGSRESTPIGDDAAFVRMLTDITK